MVVVVRPSAGGATLGEGAPALGLPRRVRVFERNHCVWSTGPGRLARCL